MYVLYNILGCNEEDISKPLAVEESVINVKQRVKVASM
jgi:hypothetical protein